jgi:hypothetical protein
MKLLTNSRHVASYSRAPTNLPIGPESELAYYILRGRRAFHRYFFCKSVS